MNIPQMALLACAALALSSVAVADPPWKMAGNIGARHFVVVQAADATDTGLLKEAAVAACPPELPCVVAFWSDSAAVPTAMPMTRTQQAAMVALYVRNPRSGTEELQLKCPPDKPSETKCLR